MAFGSCIATGFDGAALAEAGKSGGSAAAGDSAAIKLPIAIAAMIAAFFIADIR
jgi:hypothetical protein